jgi:hypothetical protein
MYIIEPIKKQTLSMKERYRQYLKTRPEPTHKLHNKYNLFDDLNSADKSMIKVARAYLHRSNSADNSINKSEKTHMEKTLSKDRGRKAIKNPKQLKVKPEVRFG